MIWDCLGHEHIVSQIYDPVHVDVPTSQLDLSSRIKSPKVSYVDHGT